MLVTLSGIVIDKLTFLLFPKATSPIVFSCEFSPNVTVWSDVLFASNVLNACLPIVLTLFGIVTFVNAVHSPNACSPISSTPSGIVISVRDLHCLNIPKLSVFMAGIVTCVILVPSNALFPIVSIFLGIWISVKELQCINAFTPIVVTLSPIVRFAKEVQLANALSPIVSTPFSITTVFNFGLNIDVC